MIGFHINGNLLSLSFISIHHLSLSVVWSSEIVDKLSHTFSRLYPSLCFVFSLSNSSRDDASMMTRTSSREAVSVFKTIYHEIDFPHSFLSMLLSNQWLASSEWRRWDRGSGGIHYTHKYRNKLFSFSQLAHTASSSNNGSASQRDCPAATRMKVHESRLPKNWATLQR